MGGGPEERPRCRRSGRGPLSQSDCVVCGTLCHCPEALFGRMMKVCSLHGLLPVNRRETRSSSVALRERGEAQHSNELLDKFLLQEEGLMKHPQMEKAFCTGEWQGYPPGSFCDACVRPGRGRKWSSPPMGVTSSELSSGRDVLSRPRQTPSLPELPSPQQAEGAR